MAYGGGPGGVGERFTVPLRFDINGDEPQSFQILSVFAPVVSGAQYRLVWKTDGSSLNSPKDPGFNFFVTQEPADLRDAMPATAGLGQLRFFQFAGRASTAGRESICGMRVRRGQ